MKKGWETKPLGDVCTFRPPKSEARNHLNATDAVSFVPMSDLGVEQKYLTPKETAPLSEVSSSYTYFADGDVLLAKITPCFENGKLGIAVGLENGIGFGSSEFFVLRPTPALDREFLYYFLSQPKVRADGRLQMGGAVGQQRVPKEYVEGLRIPLPPLAEQRRIVAILDEAFAGINAAKANAERNLQNARRVYESFRDNTFASLQQEFSLQPLGGLVEDIATGPFGSLLHKSDYEEGGIPLVNPINIEDEIIVADDRKAVSAATAKRLSRYRLKAGDIAVGRRGDIGRCAVVATDQDGWLCGTGCFVIRAGRNAVPEFLAHLLRSRPYRAHLIAKAGRATMPSISNKDLASLAVPVISPAQQRRALDGFAELSALSSEVESATSTKLAALDELKASLLHQAFTGQL